MVTKKIVLITFCLVLAIKLSAQTPIVLKGDTIVLPNGAKFWLGEEVTLGTGSNPDKSFAYIYSPEMLHITKKKPLASIYAGRKGLIKKFQRDGAYKSGYSYNILVLDLGNPLNYWCDVQGAVDSNEIVFTSNDKIANTKEAKLLHLKKLLDSGEITEEEYETLKSKIMDNKGATKNNTIKKDNNKPIIY